MPIPELLVVIGNNNISNLDRFAFEDNLQSADQPFAMAKNQIYGWSVNPAIPNFPTALIKEKLKFF